MIPDTAGDGGGVLDLGNGDLIIAPSSVPAASGTTGQASPIAALLTAGYDNGFWDGINSSGGPNPAAIISQAAADDPYQIQSLGYEVLVQNAVNRKRIIQLVAKFKKGVWTDSKWPMLASSSKACGRARLG